VAYCTVADLRNAQSDELLAQLVDNALTDPDLNYQDPDFWSDGGAAALLAQVIADATASVDDYLAGRVDTADATVQDALRRYAVAMALEALWRRAGHDPSRNPWMRGADSARARLKEMRKGELSAGSTEQPQLLMSSTTEDEAPIYARDPANPDRRTKMEADW